MSEFVKTTTIKGLYKLERPTFGDNRGFFREVFHLDELTVALGQEFRIVQMNHSSTNSGALRGLHAEYWDKLVYPLRGSAFSAIADIREDSETFGKVETFIFDDQNRFALLISRGIANSICAFTNQPVDYIYCVNDYYDPKKNGNKSVLWNDPDLAINWPIKEPLLSERDKSNPTLRQLFPSKFA